MAAGRVDPSELCEWWLIEDDVDTVTAFVDTHFPGSALVERHGQHVRCVCLFVLGECVCV